MIEDAVRMAKYRAGLSHYQRLNTYPDWEVAETDSGSARLHEAIA